MTSCNFFLRHSMWKRRSSQALETWAERDPERFSYPNATGIGFAAHMIFILFRLARTPRPVPITYSQSTSLHTPPHIHRSAADCAPPTAPQGRCAFSLCNHHNGANTSLRVYTPRDLLRRVITLAPLAHFTFIFVFQHY